MWSFRFYLVLLVACLLLILLPQRAVAQRGSVPITFTEHTRQYESDFYTTCEWELVGSHADPVGNGSYEDYEYDTGVYSGQYDPHEWTGLHDDIPGQRLTFWVANTLGGDFTDRFVACDYSEERAWMQDFLASFDANAYYEPPPNEPPTACFDFEAADELFTINFDASCSEDEDGSVVSYNWNFGGPGTGSGEGAQTSFTYDERGTYAVTLTVTDDDGDDDANSQDVEVDGPGMRYVLVLKPLEEAADKAAMEDDPTTVQVGDSMLSHITIKNIGDLPLENIELLNGEASMEVLSEPPGALDFVRGDRVLIERLEPGEEDSLLYIHEAVHAVEDAQMFVTGIQAEAVDPATETRQAITETEASCSLGSKNMEDNEPNEACKPFLVAPAPLVVNSTKDAKLDSRLDPTEDGCSTGDSIVRDGEPEVECTLRAALQIAAAHTTPIEVVFDIPEEGAVHRIAPEGEGFAAVSTSISIDGTSQPNGTIEIDGSGLEGGTSSIGFDLGSASNSATVEGLAFYGFPGTVLALRGSGGSVTGSFFGSDWAKSYTSTDATVTDALRNGGTAILVTGDNTVVGGSGGEGNLIIGSNVGVHVDGAAKVKILGNDIGVLESPHAENGIELVAAENATIGSSDAPNTIAYNLGHGIQVDKASNPVTIQGNTIERSRMDGIHLTQASGSGEGSFIGGEGDGEGNTIERSIGAGIRVLGPANAAPTDEAALSIQGNSLKENEEIGILLDGGSQVRIGGATGTPGSGAGNVIEDGIQLASGYASWVQGNMIAHLDPETGYSEDEDVVSVEGIRNIIGGAEGEGNVIYGVRAPAEQPDPRHPDPSLGTAGVGITDEGSETLMQHNFIGNDGSGAKPLHTGVALRGTRAQLIENTLSGNGYTGLAIYVDATIEGNRIGATPIGNGALPNGGPGVEMWTGATLGGEKADDACERPCNVISGNTGPGILVQPEGSGAKIQGNMIGIGLDGLTAVGNGKSGIVALADGVVIGGENDIELGDCKGPCNIIAANKGDGIRNFDETLDDTRTTGATATLPVTGMDGASGFVIEGNFIGTTIPGSGNTGTGNAGHGIALGALGSNHKVGHTGTGGGNLIAGNGKAGVAVLASTKRHVFNSITNTWEGGQGNEIRGNRIHDNGTIAIDLYPDRFVPGGDGWQVFSDWETTDYRPNKMLNWPYLVESGEGGAQGADLLVLWLGDPSASPGPYALDIYTSPGCDGAMGVAGNYLVSRQIMFPLSTATTFDTLRVDVPVVPSMPYFAATLTDSEGNTSELSNCRRAGQRPKRAIQDLDIGVQTQVNSLLITLRDEPSGALAGKQMTDAEVLVLQFDEGASGAVFEETAAQTPGGQTVVPQSTQGGYWEVVAPESMATFYYDVCIDASVVNTPDDILVLGRGATTNGVWRPFDTRLETVDGVTYACADGLSAQQLALGSGTAAVMAAPALLTPPNNTADVTSGTVFTWQPLPEAAGYDVQVALDAGFATVLYDEAGVAGTSAMPAELANNQRHYWRVRGVTGSGEAGPWSVPFRFTTADMSVDVEEETGVPERFVLEANYPNPFNPQTIIGFALPQASEVRLVVYDVLGREVARLVEGTLSAGQHEAVFDAASLPSGVYLYRLEASGFVQVRRMLLVK